MSGEMLERVLAHDAHSSTGTDEGTDEPARIRGTGNLSSSRRLEPCGTVALKFLLFIGTINNSNKSSFLFEETENFGTRYEAPEAL